MRISLIHATVNDTSLYPPLGILMVGAQMEQDGHQVQLLEPRSFETNYIDQMRNFQPDVIGFSLMTSDYARSFHMRRELAKHFPNAIYTAGGVHVTALPADSLKGLDCDFVVREEGEWTMREALEALQSGKDLAGVPGVVWRSRNGEIIDNGHRPLIPNLDDLPFEAWHLLPMAEKYLVPPGVIHGHYFERSTAYMAARGCPFSCIYCGSNIIFGRKIRSRSVDKLIGHFEFLRDTYGLQGIYFADDTFTMYPPWVEEYCQKMIDRKVGIKWSCQCRVDTVNEPLLRLMKAAGCVTVDFGVESGSEKVLKIMKKSSTPEKIVKAFDLCHKVGMKTRAFFMLGNPGETYEDAMETFRLAKRIKANRTNFYFTVPFPGTELHEMAKKHKWTDTEVDYSNAWNFITAPDPVMEIHFSKAELTKLRKKFRNAFIIRNYLSNGVNFPVIFRTLGTMLMKPATTFNNFVRAMRTGGLATFIEFAVAEYELEINRRQTARLLEPPPQPQPQPQPTH